MEVQIITPKGNLISCTLTTSDLEKWGQVVPMDCFVNFPAIQSGDSFTLQEAILIAHYYQRYGKNFVSLCAEFIDFSRTNIGEQINSIAGRFAEIAPN